MVTAVGNFIGTAPVYQKTPTYAFAIGSYIIDRNVKLNGEKNEELAKALQRRASPQHREEYQGLSH